MFAPTNDAFARSRPTWTRSSTTRRCSPTS
ncbi:hypothetical protein LV779_08575 [Streptomyces thinghirensis]|nr:hypothetical protein [Streptomyces thinghirensis]